MFREQVMRMPLRTTRLLGFLPGTCDGWLSRHVLKQVPIPPLAVPQRFIKLLEIPHLILQINA